MARNSDLEHLQRRVSRLCRSVSLPQIEIATWHQGDVPPDPKPWQLRIMIERRDQSLSAPPLRRWGVNGGSLLAI